MAAGRAFDDLDLSQDEIKRLGSALKDENFRKMLVEYAEEISDPENKRKAEEEIAMMEQERGMNVQFIHPEPGHVLKTTVDGETKAFINICQNDKIEKPNAKRQVGSDGKSGLMWQIPHSFSPPRDDQDKTRNKCTVFDVVFHPDTYRMAMKNERFLKLVEDTAVDGIERQFSVKLDKKNIKRPKITFKGTPTATVIRERISESGEVKKAVDSDNVLNQFPYPYDDKTSVEKSKENLKNNEKKAAKGKGKASEDGSKFTEPKYTITHRSQVDMSEYRNSPDAKTSTRPTELSVKIELPLLKSAAEANLEIYEKRLVLESVSPAAYKLDLTLPFPVDEEEGSAKFDKSKRTLTITLPVIPLKTPPIPFTTNGEVETEGTAMRDGNNPGPLIEVLDEKVNVVNGDSHSLQGHSDIENLNRAATAGNGSTVNKPSSRFPQNVKWQVPDYQFSQDNETLNFIIKVHNVDESSIDLAFPHSSGAIIRFQSIGAGLFPVYYSLTLEFLAGCVVSPDHSSVDVSSDNLVLLLLKEKACRGIWDIFRAGVDPDHLEEKQFLTESNLKQELSRLAEESAMPAQEGTTPELSVVEMNEKKLTIDIKPHKSRRGRRGRKDSGSSQEEEEDESVEYDDSAPSSAEIQVIHKHPTPKNLHGILKQRTMSESSEDPNHCDLPESPRSDGEDQLSSSGGLKKRSVSFNNHVDHTSFKSSASVSSMTPALKSKRKRQRKREERMKRAGRSNSEGSSSEECNRGAHSHSEGEDDDKADYRSRAGLSRSVSDPGVESTSLSPIADTAEEVDERRDRGGDAGEAPSIPGPNKVLDFRTSPTEGKHVDVSQKVALNGELGAGDVASGSSQLAASNKELGNGESSSTQQVTEVDKNKKIVSEIRSKLAGGGDGECGREEPDDSDDDFQDAVSSQTEDGAAKAQVKGSVGRSEGQGGTGDAGQKAGAGKEGSSSMSGEGEKEKADPVDTMLSWNDGINGTDHRTDCAFQFSNSVMFDLDVD